MGARAVQVMNTRAMDTAADRAELATSETEVAYAKIVGFIF